MKDMKKVQLNLFIPVHYRDMLRKMAAEQILKNPEKMTSGASIAVEILCDYLQRLENTECSSHDD